MIEKIEEKVNYCLNCKVKPCSKKGCPLHNNIPEFIEVLKKEEYLEAYKILSKTTVLSGICGKICPHDKQCQGSCVRGIKGEPVSIGELENFVYEKVKEQNYTLKDCYEIKEKKNKKVAIIGGGPAGITCAAFLAREGVDVTIYEKYLTEGVLELRARLIANEDDSQYEKADKITYYHYRIFLNSDEKHGNTDSFEINLVKSPENFRRSWHTPGNGRTITLNIGHLAYSNLQDYPDIQHDYLRELMLKEYVLLYLSEGKYDMFGEIGKEFEELEPQEAAERVIQKIENVYYQSLRS